MMSKAFVLFVLSIFVAGNNVAQQPVAASGPLTGATAAKGYLLGPGDEISGKVVGESQFDFVAAVNEDGNIMVPFSSTPVAAQCRSEKQLRSDLTALLEKQLRNPQFSLNTKRNSRPPATVYGEVRKPDNFILMRRVTLRELLALSGGATDEAGGLVEVTRTQPPLCADDVDANNWAATVNSSSSVPMKTYSLASLQMGEVDPVIYPGDMVRVHKAPPVYILGEVVAPQGIYLPERGITLRDALAMVGGIRREAKKKDIKIYRLKDPTKPDDPTKSDQKEILTVNLELVNKGEQRDIQLQAYDIVEVDKAKDSIAMTILNFALGAGKTAITSGVSSIGYRVVY